jgi:glutamine amidotransferase
MILLADLITKPMHSVIAQTFDRFLPQIEINMDHCRGCQKFEKDSKKFPDREVRNAHINADGFGIGWYSQSPLTLKNLLTPTLFRSITPAHTNENLHCLAEHTYTTLMFAHLRAASSMNVSESNCHPFTLGKFMFMHNGAVARYLSVIRFIQPHLSNMAFQCIKGTTDSEFLFALFLDCLPTPYDKDREKKEYSLAEIKQALQTTIQIILGAVDQVEKQFKQEHKCSSLNLAVTDGKQIVCTRFRDGGEHPPSLYYTRVKSLSIENGDLDIQVADDDCVPESIIVASEPLSYQEEKWTLIEGNKMVSIVDNQIYMEDIIESNETNRGKFLQFSQRDPLAEYYRSHDNSAFPRHPNAIFERAHEHRHSHDHNHEHHEHHQHEYTLLKEKIENTERVQSL